MPGLLEILLNPVSLGVLALYAAMMLWEAIAPARPLPGIRGWVPRALVSFVTYFCLASCLPLLRGQYLVRFQHRKVETPRRRGYVVQRPQSHSVHHARGIDNCNHADLPVLDMLFGTFLNPRSDSHEAGFYDGASAGMRDMLLFRDVSIEPVEQPGLVRESSALTALGEQVRSGYSRLGNLRRSAGRCRTGPLRRGRVH